MSHLRLRLLTAAAALVALVGAGNAFAAGDVVISQVYGGGGNIGATLTNDYIELYNRTSASISVTGWSVQYAATAGTNWQKTSLSGSIAPGGYYLVQQAAGAGGTTSLPTPEATGTISMAAGSGKVALVSNDTLIATGTSCPVARVDLVGYGTANCFEGTGAAPTLSATTAALRSGGGVADTDNNNADFVAGTPNPRNGGFVPPPPPTPVGVCNDDLETRIHAIQGPGSASPLVGSIRVIEGVVVGNFQGAASLNGYFIQEEDADADSDPLSSEGIFAFDPDAPVVSAGDVVRIRGTVVEFNGLTELTSVDAVVVCSSGASVTSSTLSLPVPSFASLEQFEGMLTTFAQELTATETFTLGRFGEVSLSADGRLYNPTQLVAPGAAAIDLQTENDRSRIQLDDNSSVQNPPVVPFIGADNTLRIGDTVAGLTGVLSFGFGTYRVQPTAAVSFTRANPRPTGPPTVGGSLRVAGANVLNYFTTLDDGDPHCGPTGVLDCRGANTDVEFNRQRTKIIAGLKALNADVVGLTELENNATDGPIADLVEGLNDATAAGTYAYIATGPIGTDAIRVGLVYKPAVVTPVGSFAILDSTVDARFDDTRNRPALAQAFRENGTDDVLTIAVNHLKSKGSACAGDPDLFDGQGNCNATRTRAATALVEWLATDPTESGSTDNLIVGDLNAYAKEHPIAAIEGAGYTNLVAKYVGERAYSYVFQGQSGTLDYALASPSLTARVRGADEYHINADEPVVLDYNTEFNPASMYRPDGFRTADHDPVLAGICESTAPELTVTVSPTTLSPPNHRYVTVEATVAATDKSTPTIALVSATSNEPDNGEDDGNTTNDVVIVDQDTFNLRAERSGVGTGRIYTITYRATDACGNSSVDSATVTVK